MGKDDYMGILQAEACPAASDGCFRNRDRGVTLDLCLNLNVFGLLTEARNAQMYTPIGGWSMTGEQLYIGLTRLLYPFLAGLLREWLKKF